MGLQALHAQPPSPPRRDAATAWTSEEALVRRAGGHQETRPEMYGKISNAVGGEGRAPDKGGDFSPTGGEIGAWGEHGHERPGAATVSVSQSGLEDASDGNNDARSRHQPATTSAKVPGSSSIVGGLREDEVRTEMEDFFRDDGDCRDRSSRSKSNAGTGGARSEGREAPLYVNVLADKVKESCDHPKRLEGICPDTESRGGIGVTESRSVQRTQPFGLLSEESHIFLCSDDDSDSNSGTPRRRMVSDATNQRDRSTLGVPARITKRRSDDVGAEANVEREAHGLEQKRAVRREVFDSFLLSDDESDVLPGMTVCPAKCTGDGKSGYSGDTGGGGSGGGTGHDEDCSPERRHTRVLGEQETEIDKQLHDTLVGDNLGLDGPIRDWRGSDSSDAHASLECGKHSRSEQRASTREKETISPDTPDSVDNGSRQPPGVAVEANDARVGGRQGSGYNDGGGGASLTSVTAPKFPTELPPVISDGARSGRHDVLAGRAAWKAGGALSRAYPPIAVAMAGEGNDPVSVVTQSIPPCGSDDENIRSRQSSWSPTGLLGQVERVTTVGMDTPPADHDVERERRAPWTPPTATTTGKTIPPRGRTGWSLATMRQFWEARQNDNKNGSKRVGGTSLREVYSAGGENSHWEVRGRLLVRSS